jgi:hypothetical protein
MKNFYRKMDEISNKITKLYYENIVDYQNDLITLLKKEVKCIGGICSTVYSKEDAIYFEEDYSKYQKTLNYMKKFEFNLDPCILHDPNIEFKYLFSIPIYIDDIRGVIYLFDDNKERFQYFENILNEINKIKIDNDLENLANQLKLKKIKNKYPHIKK